MGVETLTNRLTFLRPGGRPTTGDVIPLSRRKVWLHVPGLITPVRAVLVEVGRQGVIVDCELGWLRLGEPVSVELGPGERHEAVLRWVDVAGTASQRDGAQLRIAVDFARPLDDAGERTFFARASALSDAGQHSHADHERNARAQRRRSALKACLVGVVLGIGILQVPMVQSLVNRAARRTWHSVPAAHK